MADGDDILQKADALMRRHRIFVAGAADAPETVEAVTDADADDVPVLTEVIDPDAVSVAHTVHPQAQIDPARLREALVVELETWLDQALPQHVMRVLDGITDQMISQLSAQARGELLPRLHALLEARETAPDRAPDEV